MSSSRTNMEKSVKHHRGPLTGMAIGLTFVALLLLGFLIWTFYQSDNPEAQSPASAVSGEVVVDE